MCQAGFALHCSGLARKSLILQWRDVRVVEGARLESEMGDAHELTLKHFAAHSIQRLTALPYSSMSRRKRRYFPRVSSLPYTVLTQFPLSLARVLVGVRRYATITVRWRSADRSVRARCQAAHISQRRAPRNAPQLMTPSSSASIPPRRLAGSRYHMM